MPKKVYNMRRSRDERFFSKVAWETPTDAGCWLWTASTKGPQYREGGGYGAFWNGTRLVGAHQYAWEWAHGPIPAGKQVLHRCDVRLCCNPEHLFLGTQLENIADMVAKGRQGKHDHRGERNPNFRHGMRTRNTHY